MCFAHSTPPPVPCKQPVPRDGPEAVLREVDPTCVLRIVDRFHLGSPETIAAIGGGIEDGSVARKLCAHQKPRAISGQWVEATDTCDARPRGSSSAVESPVIRCFLKLFGKVLTISHCFLVVCSPRSGLSLRSRLSGRPSRGTLETLLLLLLLLLLS